MCKKTTPKMENTDIYEDGYISGRIYMRNPSVCVHIHIFIFVACCDPGSRYPPAYPPIYPPTVTASVF